MILKSAHSEGELMERLSEQRVEGRLCDVRFALGQLRLSAHSCIVDAASPLLSKHLAELSGGGSWSVSSPLLLELPLLLNAEEPPCPLCFSNLLLFIYKREIEVGAEHIVHFRRLAAALQVDELVGLLAAAAAPAHLSCPTCAEEFGCGEALEAHRRVAHNPMYACLKCDFTCRKLRSLMAHLEECPPGDTCPLCLFTTPSPPLLLQHIQEHKGAHPFPCDVCHRRFKSRSLWSVHTCPRRLPPPKPLDCPTCHKTFTKVTSYEQHLSRHRSTNKYSCKVCTYSAPYESYLKRHMSKHTDQLTCTYPGCSFETPWKHNLKQHIDAHKNTRLFSCLLCNAVFSYDKNLRRHLKVVHERREFNCQLCQFKSTRLDKLKAHCQCEHLEEGARVEAMLSEYRAVDRERGNKFIDKYKRTERKWKTGGERGGEESERVCLSETTGEFTLLKEGSIPVASVTSTNLLTIGNFRQGTGSVTLNEVTGVLTLNNLNSESTGAVFLNESTGELSYISLNQGAAGLEDDEGGGGDPLDMDTPDFNDDTDDDFDNFPFDPIAWADDSDFLSECLPHLNEATGELSFESVWQEFPLDDDPHPTNFPTLLNEETGELVSYQ